ncbi:MAG: hypothetical protein K2H86_08790, partial [Muribaculaceae bacterium]|nr:hypothetical protein [Muribaculaceae bacterium]
FIYTILIISSLSASATIEIPVMKDAIFYDGYKTDVIVDADADDNILRLANSLYSVKLDPKSYSNIGNNLTLHVTLTAKCDNYDRMGDVRLAFVPKGAQSYGEDEVQRVELARFITPFMDMNADLNQVPFEWNIADAAYIFRDPQIAEQYDLWLETYLFGVPYAAQKQIDGCSDRNDVYAATVWLTADDDTDGSVGAAAAANVVYPLYTTKSELLGNVNFNRYTEGATDQFAKTERTFTFSVEKDLTDAKLNLILTNHGADERGEEYVRRLHNVYVDGELLLSYMPGGISCEPYRVYNTQANMIYGLEPQTDWEEWNNWCPGQAVPIRQIHIGALSAGEHSVKITVPKAQFFYNKGDFRPSLYVQGLTDGELGDTDVKQLYDPDFDDIVFERTGDTITLSSTSEIREVALYDFTGNLLEGTYNPAPVISLGERSAGTYILLVVARDGRYTTYKFVK